MRTNCDDIALVLSARLDGEATASQWRLAEEHMATCLRCAQTWQSFQAGTDLLKNSLPQLEPSSALWHKISDRLETAARPARPLQFVAWWRRFLEFCSPQT